MGMQSASIQQSPNPSSGKGMGAPLNFVAKQNDPNANNQMQSLLSGNVIQGPSNNGQFDPTEGGMTQTAANTSNYGSMPTMNNMMTSDAMPVRNQAMGKGGSGNVTRPQQGGQPKMGMPNAYSNTIQPWDNASIQTRTQSGKGKGY